MSCEGAFPKFLCFKKVSKRKFCYEYGNNIIKQMRISNLFILLLKGTLSHKQRLPYRNNTNLIRLVSHSLMSSSACSLIVWYDLYYRVFQGSNEVTITIRVSHTLNSCFHFPLSPKSTPQSYDISPIASFKKYILGESKTQTENHV